MSKSPKQSQIKQVTIDTEKLPTFSVNGEIDRVKTSVNKRQRSADSVLG
jgi:hypothetical protein